MMATSHGVEIEAKMQGGLIKGLKRSVLGGESLFMTTLTAPSQGGWVDVAARLPGDLITVLEVGAAAQPLARRVPALVRRPSRSTRSGAASRTSFGGEGGFLIHASGRGTIVVSCYGALDLVRARRGRVDRHRLRPRRRVRPGRDVHDAQGVDRVMNTLK